MSSAPLRRVISRALRAASRARAASMILPTMALRFCRVLQQEFARASRATRGLDHALHFRRDQLVLGLRGELRIGQLDREDRRQAFARVVAGGRDLLLLREPLFLDVVVQRARQRGAETGQVRAAVLLRNVVRVAEHRLLVGVVPLHRDFDARSVLPACGTRRPIGWIAGPAAVQVLDERLQAALVLEHVASCPRARR